MWLLVADVWTLIPVAYGNLHYGLFTSLPTLRVVGPQGAAADSLLVRSADSRVGVDGKKFLLNHFTNGTER